MRAPVLGGFGLAVAATVLASTAAGCGVSFDRAAYAARDQKRFEISGVPDVRLTTFDGSLEVRAWDRPEVMVDIERQAATEDALQSITVLAEQSGNQIRVETRRPEDGSLFQRGQRTARIVASVPQQANLFAQSGDGRITIERVSGRIEIRTGDGSIRGIELGGAIDATTGDGSIRLDRVTGIVRASTGDGGVSVEGQIESARLHTGDGAVQLRAVAGSVMRDDWELTTGDGGVVVYLPADFDAEIDAETGDGAVRVEHQITADGDAAAQGGRRLVGSIGRGGRLLRIRTPDGIISIRGS